MYKGEKVIDYTYWEDIESIFTIDDDTGKNNIESSLCSSIGRYCEYSVYDKHQNQSILSGKKVAYFVARWIRPEADSQDDWKLITSVYSYDYGTSEIRNIYEMENSRFEDTIYPLMIKDIGLSADSSLLAITTSTGILVYNFEDETIEELFDNKTWSKIIHIYGPDLCSYESPEFSYDTRYLKFTEICYDGKTFNVYDIQNDRLVDSENFSFYENETVIGWYKDNLLIEKLAWSEDSVKIDNSSKPGLYIVDPKDPYNCKLVLENFSVNNYIVQPVGILNDWFYYLDEEHIQEKTGKYSCGSNGEKREVLSYVTALKKYNLKTDEGPLKVLSVDSTNWSGLEELPKYATYRPYSLQGEEELLMRIAQKNLQYNYYVVNDDNTLSKLIFTK